MKILLVNNHTEHLDSLRKSLVSHDVEVVEYKPGISFNEEDKDLIILSGGGGEGLEISDKIGRHKLWYQDEMDFVRRTDKPVLGICMGFEVIVNAYGGKIHYRPELTYGFKETKLNDEGRKLFGQQDLKQVEAHYWYVPAISDELTELARSDSGIEIVKHKTKRQIGLQFHPEADGGTLQLSKILSLA